MEAANEQKYKYHNGFEWKFLKLDFGNTYLMEQKQKLLTQAISETKERLANQQANKSAVALQKIGATGDMLEVKQTEMFIEGDKASI